MSPLWRLSSESIGFFPFVNGPFAAEGAGIEMEYLDGE
jgi:hypothetical protein